jgi:DNA-binding MarR family transcriptional regulator
LITAAERRRRSGDSLSRLLRRFRSLATLSRSLARACGDVGLSLPEGHLLCLLERSGPRHMSGLSAAVLRGPSTITALVDRLEAKGLVVRREERSNRRVRLVALTREGEELVSRMIGLSTRPAGYFAASTR